MTINQMTKNDLDLLYKQVDIQNIDIGALFAVKKVIETEIDMSIHADFAEPHLTPRNLVCFDNCMKYLDKGNIVDAWWELTDITSYKETHDYITTSELVLIKIAINNLIGVMDK